MSHFSSIFGDRQPIVQIIDDDDNDDDGGGSVNDDNDVVEVPGPTPARSSARRPSRLSLFVTPNPTEPRTTATPSTRRRSTSALQARRASSAPNIDASSRSSYIDLTGDSDEEAENDNVASGKGEDKKKEGSVQAKDDNTMNGAIEEAADGVPSLFNSGTKRARLTSPASEGGGDTKRQKSNEVRTGSLPLRLASLPLTNPAQTWSFPPKDT